MHLINQALENLIPPRITPEELGEIHADALQKGLEEVTQPKKTRSKVLGDGDSAVKIEQLVSELSRDREALLKPQNEKFAALAEALIDKKASIEPGEIKVVEPTVSPVSRQDGGKAKEYELPTTKITSLKQLDHKARNDAMDTIDAVVEKTKTLKVQIATLRERFDRVGVEGGVRNKKIADQAKFLQEKARELRTQLVPFKQYFNEHIQNCVRYSVHQLDRAIDEVSQIVEETQRNRNLVDGLGLPTKPWHGEPFSVEEGANIIADHEIGLTWRDVPDEESEEDLVQPSLPSVDQVSDQETDVDSITTGSVGETDGEKSLSSASGLNSPRSLLQIPRSPAISNSAFESVA
ncbi:MAG: hypothetical protein FJ390_08295 [Verrucomicrobia bacterium]|nr:hypothetical protein [Verrucomicrobiota bacterium]